MRKTTILLLSMSLSLVSCSLKEKNTSYSDFESYYRNETQIHSGVNGCYTALRTILNNMAFFNMTESATDLLYFNLTNLYDATCNISPSRPGVGKTVWQYGYVGVMRCNEMIQAVLRAREKEWIGEDSFRKYYAEAVILRAYYYYLLTCTFGDVPFYTERVTEENRKKIASLPRMSADETRDYLIDELSSVLMPSDKGGGEYLPLVRSYDAGSEYRISAATGLVLAGKMAMWNQRWDDAIRIFSVIEDIYGHYDSRPASFGLDYPLTDVPFSRKWTPESIFEISNFIQTNGVNNYATIAYMLTPRRSTQIIEVEEGDIEEYNAYDIYDGSIAIPELGGNLRGTSSVRPNAYLYLQLLPYAGKDLRSGEYNDVSDPDSPRGGSGTLAWRWKGYAPNDIDRKTASVLWFGSTKSSGTNRPWLGNKFWCYGVHDSHDDNNYKMFRYSGVLLNLAEAYLESGNSSKACAYLNVTRTRAGLDPVSLESVGGRRELLMEEIRMECGRELVGEFQRKFDLVRWGIWYERTVQYNEGSNLQNYIRPCHCFYPIPAEQITYSGGNLDNAEYMN